MLRNLWKIAVLAVVLATITHAQRLNDAVNISFCDWVHARGAIPEIMIDSMLILYSQYNSR